MTDDAELLRLYASDRAEEAFAELVRRHLPFVYAAALRQVGGDTALAQDVTQGVFADLARKAADLARHRVLVGWLFTSTRYAAAKAVRSEQRRRVREQEAHTMHELNYEPAACADWTELRPVIDEVLAGLEQNDREAVLLRFFEGRAFPEIGARFSITGDAARLRVERALEKMRGGLAKHGVKSTPAALALALANQPAVALPAGLAASVTGAALTSSATGGGTAVAVGLSTFMSTTKIGMWGVAAVVLFVSLAGNAYLLTSPPSVDASPRVTPPVGMNPSLAKSTTATGSMSAVLSAADLTELRDQLRSAGSDEAAIRAVLEGILRQRYRERLSADRAERAKRGWWRDPSFGQNGPEYPMQIQDDQRLLREVVTLPLEQLLGPDPLAVAEAEARYAYLPPELREAFGRLDRALPASATRTGVLEVDARLEAETSAQRRSLTEQRKALIDSLTPAQRLDWEMHNSQLATTLSRQLGPVDATEDEYRAVFPLAENFSRSGNAPGAEGPRVNISNQQMMDQLVTALGYDRALDFIWSGASEYAPYARVTRDANLPASTAGQVMELAAETAKRAAAIHGDGTLDVAAKRAALVALQQSVQPALDALVPPAVQQRLAPKAQTWLTGLSEGIYKPILGSLPGAAGAVIMSPQYVDRPPPASLASLQPLPTRPSTK